MKRVVTQIRSDISRLVGHAWMALGVVALTLPLAAPAADMKDYFPPEMASFFGSPSKKVVAIAFAPGGTTLAVAYDYPTRVCLWNVAKRSPPTIVLQERPESPAIVRALVFSPDGTRLAVSIEKLPTTGSARADVRFYDAERGQLLQSIPGAGSKLLAFSPDGKLFVSGMRVWTMPEGKLSRTLEVTQRDFWVFGSAFSPDGGLFAVAGFVAGNRPHPSPVAFLFDLKTGKVLKSLLCPDEVPHSTCVDCNALKFSPNGKSVAIGTIEDWFYLWNIDDDRATVVRRPGGRWWNIAISSDGQLLAASGAGGSILFWDISKHKELCSVDGHLGSVYGMEFSPNGLVLASGGADGAVRLWEPENASKTKWKSRTLEIVDYRKMNLGTDPARTPARASSIPRANAERPDVKKP
jgi:WD40 repeat protein